MMEIGPGQIGKWLIATGIIIALFGVLLTGLGRIGLFKLPGDLEFGPKNDSTSSPQSWRVYVPITSCIIISIILTVIFWIINYLRR